LKRVESASRAPDSAVVGAIAFGIPDEIPKQSIKKQLNEIVHFEKW
jgi:hypothetical protein